MTMKPTTQDPAQPGEPALSFVIPTLDEAGNIRTLLDRLSGAVNGTPIEVIFVDDSSDATPDEVRSAGTRPEMHVVLVHRRTPDRWGGLGGAVVDGLRVARAPVVCVMDADLQHPPETVPVLLERARQSGADVVVASRYGRGGGSRSGLYRRTVSRLSTALAKVVVGGVVREVSDPLSGFFVVRPGAVSVDELRPTGFKILLEILVRSPGVCVDEVGYEFGERYAERSKASIREAVSYLTHLAALRRGRVLARPDATRPERTTAPREP